MCGIIGYIGKRKAIEVVLEGLQRLEYRGYDSAGIAALVSGKLIVKKQPGKVSFLQEALKQEQWSAEMAVAHTRWATHGKPTIANAHPHFDHSSKCAVVHNGIIENHQVLRSLLQKQQVHFTSETDTEVISQLIGQLYKGDLLLAVKEAIDQLEGAFAIAVMHEAHPGEMVVAARKSPLCIGICEQ